MLVINTLIQLRKNMSKNNKSGSTPHDWKKFPKKQFPYKSIEDPKYIKERNAFFKENGDIGCEYNGWWWQQGADDAK